MFKYILKRIALLLPMLLGISLIIFAIMSFTPGDPAIMILGANASEEALDTLRNELGFNQPFWVHYFRYLGGVIQGDFGNSYLTGLPVFTEILLKFPVTLLLSLAAIILAILIGISLGVLSAVRQYSKLDVACTVTAIFMGSIPNFWVGMILILIFSLHLGWLPPYGIGSIAHYIMPTITLALPTIAKLMRFTRATMLETIRQDYIRTARSKGINNRDVILRHALKNALLPVVTVAGMRFGRMIGGTVIIETIFSIPGVGSTVLNAIKMKDVPQIMAAIIFLSSLYGLIMLGVDLISARIDPRIRARYSR